MISRSVPQRPTATGASRMSSSETTGSGRSSSPTMVGSVTTRACTDDDLLGLLGTWLATEPLGEHVRVVPDDAADLLDPPARHVDLDARGAQRSGATPGVVEEGRSDAEDALGVLLVVDGVSASADHLQVGEQRFEGGDRV